MLPATTARVEHATSESVNERIAADTRRRLRHLADHPRDIGRRLAELDREWDIERTLEANAATLAFTGTALGALVDRRFLLLPALVTGFLLQHALQGWCPPVPILRRLGVRTAGEIERERTALKALRGDFRALEDAGGSGGAAARTRRAFEAAGPAEG